MKIFSVTILSEAKRPQIGCLSLPACGRQEGRALELSKKYFEQRRATLLKSSIEAPRPNGRGFPEMKFLF
jgi:hypothetical protein